MDKFEQLYHKYKNLVYWIAMQRVHDHQKAEDCVQDTFMFLFSNLDKINESDSVSAKNYIAAVAQGKAISMYRKSKFEFVVFTQDMSQQINIDDWQIFEDYDTLELSLAIDKLTEEKRNMVILKYYHGLKSNEIGNIYGISDALVRKRLQTALSELRSHLEVTKS